MFSKRLYGKSRFDLVQQKKWDALQPWTEKVDRLFNRDVATGFMDSAEDRMVGVATGFLTMSLRSRGPYTSATEQDLRQLRTWMQANTPEFLEL